MNAVIIGAMTQESLSENNHRHALLLRFLKEYCSHDITEVFGSDGNFVESAVMVHGYSIDSEGLWSYINAGRLFEQDYFLYIENDHAYQVDCADGGITPLGVWWDIDDPSCPDTVKEAVVAKRLFTQTKDAARQTWGIQSHSMAKEWAERVKLVNTPSFFGGPEKLQRDAHLARTYPY